MGGMQALEWAFYEPDYVRAIVPIATSGRHSAWCISWGEAQRQAIYSDPLYRKDFSIHKKTIYNLGLENGFYTLEDPPINGLAAARMSALLTYRSRNSFESRFGRNVGVYLRKNKNAHIFTPGEQIESASHTMQTRASDPKSQRRQQSSIPFTKKPIIFHFLSLCIKSNSIFCSVIPTLPRGQIHGSF